VLKTGGGDSVVCDDASTKSLVQQNIELRRKLEEDHSGYKRKLQAYQDGQQRQAQLVQKLQAKVQKQTVKIRLVILYLYH
jgi:rootletin